MNSAVVNDPSPQPAGRLAHRTNSWKWEKFSEDIRCFARGKMEPLLWLREMGGYRSLHNPRVYGISYEYLGDHWVGLCQLVRFRRFSRQAHRLSLPSLPGAEAERRKSLVKEIAKILEVESELEFAEEPPELPLAVHPARNGETLQVPGVAAKKREWISVQFDGISQPHLNPTAEERESFLQCFEPTTLRPIGRPLTLAESANVLAGSKLFIGVSSGMSHVAASTRTPTLIFLRKNLKEKTDLYVYKRLRRWNPYPNTHFFSNLGELKSILSAYNF